MDKKYLLYKKQEKRIVKLMYRKGLIDDLDFDNLYFIEDEKYKWINGKCYKKTFPKVFYGQREYWGEWDEWSVVEMVVNDIIYKEYDYDFDNMNDAIQSVNMIKNPSRQKLIKYLSGLKNKYHDSKINKILIFKDEC